MRKGLLLLACLLWGLSFSAMADVLIVADEFPAMEYLASQLKAQDGISSQVVAQTNLPENLGRFQAVVVYIHLGLAEPAENAFIRYAQGGGRLVLLHHSISSGKRQNRSWFKFLGVELPQGDLEHGGYKWIEGVSLELGNLTSHYITTNRVGYPGHFAWTPPNGGSPKQLPSFTLEGTEVYLNHVLSGPRLPLLALHYTDAKTGQTWTQATAGWIRSAEKGVVIYLVAGHTVRDFENPAYGRIVLNAIAAPPEQIQVR